MRIEDFDVEDFSNKPFDLEDLWYGQQVIVEQPVEAEQTVEMLQPVEAEKSIEVEQIVEVVQPVEAEKSIEVE